MASSPGVGGGQVQASSGIPAQHQQGGGSLARAFPDPSTTLMQLRKKSNVNIMVVHTHANLLIECEDMKQSQLIKFLAAVEDFGLTILHLNINSIHNSNFYSLSLKMEDECKIRSAEEISGSVERVLNSLNISSGTRNSSVTNQNQDEEGNVNNEY